MNLNLKLTLSLLLTAGVIWLFSTSFGQVPALGSFFHPAQGFWANAEIRPVTGEITLRSDKLQEPVEVFFDERGVPHIFAQNDRDLYFAQGYVTARDRLFQMEMQIRGAGGMLSEWMGESMLWYDRNQRRLGMMYGAERAMEEINNHPDIAAAIEAYAEGVNAYIETLRPETYPLEYKILGAEPAEWKPVNTALLLKYMTQMLAGRNDDVRTSNTLAHFGEEFVNRFISARPALMDPVIPPGTEWDFDPLEVEKPDELFLPSHTEEIEPWQPDPLNGSNSWVVDGSKTAGGYPILSNDMHLNMTLPSIWYEVQLQTPDHNVYGVTLQGAPTVIVGFNEYIAWGSTNVGADVMDWYEITFRDEERNEYLHDGEWLPVERRVETIYMKDGSAVQDTIIFTHHGPVYETREETAPTQIIQRDYALRWIAHDPSNELPTFYKLNRAKNVEDFRDAFSTYQAPAQNLNFAGIDGDIAMQSAGRYSLKWEYQGRAVSNGSDSRYDWQGFIPYEQNPYSVNPERGFLSAANQYPADTDYPYYLGEAFAPFERGRRINDRLSEMEGITLIDLKQMFMDNFSYHAYTVLPSMLAAVPLMDLTGQEREIYDMLAAWNLFNDGDQIEPSVFRTWWNLLHREIWDDKYDSEFPMRRPSRDITVELILDDPESEWFNNARTEERETFEDLARKTFPKAIEQLTNRHGEFGENWQWGFVNNTNLNHLGQIPGLGEPNIFTDGGDESINAIRGSHGPSWRMIVELDPDGVRGYGVYPGGQSGNPGSRTYNEFIETWRTGELYELLFLKEKPDNRDGFPLVIRFE